MRYVKGMLGGVLTILAAFEWTAGNALRGSPGDCPDDASGAAKAS